MAGINESLYANPFGDITPQDAPQAIPSPIETSPAPADATPNNPEGYTVSLEFPKPENPEAPTFSETTSAHWHTSLIYDFARRSYELLGNAIQADSNYRPLDDPAMSLADPQDIGELSNSRSNPELMRGIIDRATQREARKTIENSSLLSNMGSDIVVNPWMYILPVGELRAAYTLGRGIVYGFAKTGAVVGAQAAVIEGATFALEETRSPEDAAISAAAQSVVAGLIGGVAGGLGSVPAKEYLRSVSASMKGFYQQFRVNEKGVIEALEAVDNSGGAQKYMGDITNLGETPPKEPPGSGGSGIGVEGDPFPGRTVEGESLNQEFSIKGFGPASPFIWVGSKIARNPVLLGKTSPSLTTQAVTNDFFTHNLRLNKTAIDGVTQTPSLQELIAKADAENFITSQNIKDAYARYLGVDVKPDDSRIIAGSIRVPLAKAKNQFSGTGKMDEAEFNRELYRGVVTGEHDDPFISAEAKRLNEESNRVISERLKQAGYSIPDNPYGAANHLSRRYDDEAIIGDQPNKVATLKGWFGAVNESIKEIRKPVNELAEKARLLKESGDSKGAKDIESQIRKLNQQLQDAIIQDKYDPKLLVGDRGMSWDEIQQLKSLRKPITDLKRKITIAGKKTPENVSLLKESLKVERDKINQGVIDGSIPESLVRKTPQGNFRLRKVNKGTRKLGEILTDDQLADSAYKTFLNITHLSPDQLSNQGSSGIKRGSVGASLTEPRVLLENDIDLIDAGFLRTDVAEALATKNKAATRLLVMNDWMKKAGWDGTQDQKTYLAQLVATDYKQLQQDVINKFSKRLEKNPEKAEKIKLEQSKALNKLAKREKLDVSINETAYNRLMGTYSAKDGDAIKAMRVLKKWAASTQLLANIIPTTEDFITGVYNHGLKNYMVEGPVPYLRNLATLWKKGNAQVKTQIRGMGIGIESELAINGERINDTLGATGPMGRVESALDKAAKGGQILGLAAPASDFARRINASASVNLLIKDLQKWQKGKVSKRIERRFQDGRFDPNKIVDGKRLGDLILENFNQEGQTLGGAYLLNRHLWKSAKASEEVERIVRNEVGRTIFSGNNPASFPNELDPNGIASGFFMYMGHSFSTINNFTIPFLQNLKDAQKFQGILAIWALAAIQDPLRKIIRGEELTDEDFDPWGMTVKSLQNTQLLGAVGEYFTRLNAIFDIVPSAQTNKHKWHASLGELIMGPGGALLQNAGQVSAALVNDEWNKVDQNRLPKVIPWLNMWYLRQPYQNFVEDLDLPKTRANARALNED